MRILNSPDMIKLMEIFKPYREEKGYKLKPNAPKEAVDAYEKYYEIRHTAEKEYQEALYADFDE